MISSLSRPEKPLRLFPAIPPPGQPTALIGSIVMTDWGQEEGAVKG